MWQVAWAHPKFGSLLASCSYDGAVIVWKEAPQQQTPHHQQLQQPYSYQQPYQAPHMQQPAAPGWIKVKEHRLHESSVNAISWAPEEFGLALACASSDGRVSVLAYNVEQGSWDAKAFAAHQVGCNAVSWCTSPSADYLAALATGSQPAAPAARRLVSGGCDNLAKVWRADEATGEWRLDATLEGHSDWVRDAAWAPSNGLHGQRIATCSQDKSVLVWSSTDGHAWSKAPLASEPFGDTVWRVSWSVAGNLLAVSCGDNSVSLWRETADGAGWEQISKADQATMAQ